MKNYTENLLDYLPNLEDYKDLGVPALFLKNVTKNQLTCFNKSNNGPLRVDFKVLKISNRIESKVADYVLFTSTEQEAITAFRRKYLYLKSYKKTAVSTYDVELYGIDADLNLRKCEYVPILNIELKPNHIPKVSAKEILSKALKGQEKYFFIEVEDFGEKQKLVAQVYNNNVRSLDFDDVRKKLFNAGLKTVDQDYKIELLDERGGKNLENIQKFLPPYMVYQPPKEKELELNG